MKKMSLAEYVKKLSFGGEIKAHDPKRFGLPKAELTKQVAQAQVTRKVSTDAVVAAAAARGLTVNRRYNDESCWDWSSPFKPDWLMFAHSDREALHVLQNDPLSFQLNVASPEVAGHMDFKKVSFTGALTQAVYDGLCKDVLAGYKVAHIATAAEEQAFYDDIDAWWKSEGRFEEQVEEQGLRKDYEHALLAADQFGEERPTAAQFLK